MLRAAVTRVMRGASTQASLDAVYEAGKAASGRASATTKLDYGVSGGLDAPSMIGLSEAAWRAKQASKPRPLLIRASAGGRVQWTVDMGEAVRDDVQIIEAGELTIVRIGPSLAGIDSNSGSRLWTSLAYGAHHELLERPEYGLGVWGCSGCSPPTFHMWIEAGLLLISETTQERWLNVVRPQDGHVLMRRIMY